MRGFARKSLPATFGGRWKPVTKSSRIANGTIPVAAGALSSSIITPGITVTLNVRQGILVRRYFSNFSDAANSESLFMVSAILVDFNAVPMLGTPVCLGEYSFGDWVTRHAGFAGVPPGQMLTFRGHSAIVTGDFYGNDDFREMLPLAGFPSGTVLSFNMLSAVDVVNNDGAAAHTVTWREIASWEIWEQDWAR